ncbi:biogenesis of lysosome-related organelles complex-1, subunit 2 [Kipferlia bialata]|uniref:Biogenesis of lysosome-related organelles complex-1, subunit 2 n=1 Tax=Kipferlia bialata TaxID=797122 RepID=A0A9K3CYI9_9EUKA|nr:biogenesis of lysosome-related organelles complex-1, subunit 2 [Kipferlia bialata]|eukprot:g5458.t1
MLSAQEIDALIGAVDSAVTECECFEPETFVADLMVSVDSPILRAASASEAFRKALRHATELSVSGIILGHGVHALLTAPAPASRPVTEAPVSAPLADTEAELRLLRELNEEAFAEYKTMADMTHDLLPLVNRVKEKYAEMRPVLDCVDDVENGITVLESTVQALELYVGEVETRVKAMEAK